uniref:Uncharacterized protein n=1 Tax=Rhizophora mucronata TaxID=61149 RepID=A0A2P2LD74_RHIMU
MKPSFQHRCEYAYYKLIDLLL